MRLPDKLRSGPPNLVAKLNEIIAYMRSLTPRSSDTHVISPCIGGTGFTIGHRPRRAVAGGSSDGLYPFEAIQDPDASGAAAWRTVIFNAGTLNSVHPTNDSSYPVPTSVEIPASATLYKAWLTLTITPATGAVTAVVIDHGAAGWQIADGDLSNFPDQPTPAAPGEAPAKWYRLLTEFTTSDDVDAILTRYPTTMTNLEAARIVTGFGCNISTGVLETTYSMALWPAS